jgi:hypothetical protein
MIYLFTESNDLVEHLKTLGGKESVSVLDFTGDAGVRNAAGKRLVPPLQEAFTGEEKERIMDEYVEVISEMGKFNNFSLQWLCHPISEKNDLVPGNLFDRLIDFLFFHRVLSEFKGETLIISVSNLSLIRNIKDYLTGKNIAFTISGSEPKSEPAVSSLRRFYGLLKELFSGQYRYLNSRFLWKRLDKAKTYTVVRTWFDSRSSALITNGEDVYFGRFPKFLKERGHHILYFGGFGHGFAHEFENLKGDLNHPVVPGRSLIHGLDFIKANFFFLSVKRKLRLKKGLTILDVDVDTVFDDYFRQHLRNPHIRTNYFSYLEVVKLVKKLKIDRFFMPFENYAWEKLTQAAISRYAPVVKVTAFQHAQVALNAAKFFVGKAESRASLLPQRIVTLGEVTKQFFITKKNYPAEILTVGCALRHEHSTPGSYAERKRKRRILVQLWSFERSVQLINFIHAAALDKDGAGYEVTLNPHPCHPMKKLIPHLDFEFKDEFTVARGSLKENFDRNDLVIYHGTTTCLDALAAGLPVIDVEFDDFITVDPLFDFDDFKWKVEKPGDLNGAIGQVYALSDEEYYRQQRKGFEFVSRYFYPVTEENMEKFLRK